MRVLLAIGCNSYDYVGNLAEAESDAKRMFQTLIRPEIGQYDEERSIILLSPSLEEVRNCLRIALFTDPKPETFTFFFAGHGGVSAGSFYMWVRDSTPQSQSMSALSLADVFRSLNEASPRQSNIIIDACESGGLIADLSVLLKPDLLGDAGTPALTLVATSAQNQTSGETQAGGIGTNAILDCIEGRDFVQDSTGVLDLVEIGRRVSTRLRDSGQNPVVWGLNLYGPPSFCRNPRYASDPTAPLRDVVQNWPAVSDELVKKNYESLWAAYVSLTSNWSLDSFSEVVDSVLQSSISEPEVIGGLAERLAATFLPKAAQSDDPFRSAQVAACLAISLLPYIANDSAAASAQRLLNQTGAAIAKANALLISNVYEDRYALLSSGGGGLGDLYYLPIKLSKVLAWSAAATLICEGNAEFDEANSQFSILLSNLLENYGPSFVALNDAQAVYWFLALSCAARLNMLDEGEQLAGRIFHSLIHCGGKIAKGNLTTDRVLDYLLARNENNYSKSPELIERPIETLTVLLKTASHFGLGEVFDESFWKIDELNFSAYIPVDYLQFNAPMMEGGQNLIWSIGRDVFKTEDLLANWPQTIPIPSSDLEAKLAIVSSVVHPDRIPWFVGARCDQ